MKTFALIALLILSLGSNAFLCCRISHVQRRVAEDGERLTNTVSFASMTSAVIGFNAGWNHADPEQFGKSLQKHFATKAVTIEMTRTNLVIHKLE